MNKPKAQPYPSSKIKVGAVLYSASAGTDDGKTYTEISEWIVRSIRAKRGTKSRNGVIAPFAEHARKYVNLIAKVEFVTWGKVSGKTGDRGWLKSIPTYCRRQFAVGDDLPTGIYTTIRAAVLYEIAVAEGRVAWYKKEIEGGAAAADLTEEQMEIEAELKALKRRLAKL